MIVLEFLTPTMHFNCTPYPSSNHHIFQMCPNVRQIHVVVMGSASMTLMACLFASVMMVGKPPTATHQSMIAKKIFASTTELE